MLYNIYSWLELRACSFPCPPCPPPHRDTNEKKPLGTGSSVEGNWAFITFLVREITTWAKIDGLDSVSRMRSCGVDVTAPVPPGHLSLSLSTQLAPGPSAAVIGCLNGHRCSGWSKRSGPQLTASPRPAVGVPRRRHKMNWQQASTLFQLYGALSWFGKIEINALINLIIMIFLGKILRAF